ncbi:hypothetical protein DFH09DRAFT_1269290 [Mycena vulgaris]|nr:hypothetical protein DFH09DRAFT_1269290 [Mycena vulgaris]
MKLNSSAAFGFLILQAICVSRQTPLSKSGGLNDEWPTYDNPEDAVYKAIEPKLKRRWTDDVAANPGNAWQEYPRPLLQRDTWLNLNGERAIRNSATVDVVVEHPPSDSNADSHQTTRPRFSSTGNKSRNTGGYDKFLFDITSHVTKNATNEILLFIYDPTHSHDGNVPIGKQCIVPSHIFCTPCTGIWQTVSLETVPSTEYITDISLHASAAGTSPHIASILSGHQLINSVSGWNDWGQCTHNINDYHDNHHYSSLQYCEDTLRYEQDRVPVRVWRCWSEYYPVIQELCEQTEMFDCNGRVYTQTTDIEGEVNGFLTYDREVDHVDTEKWKAAIQALYDTFNTKVSGHQTKLSSKDLMMQL